MFTWNGRWSIFMVLPHPLPPSIIILCKETWVMETPHSTSHWSTLWKPSQSIRLDEHVGGLGKSLRVLMLEPYHQAHSMVLGCQWWWAMHFGKVPVRKSQHRHLGFWNGAMPSTAENDTRLEKQLMEWHWVPGQREHLTMGHSRPCVWNCPSRAVSIAEWNAFGFYCGENKDR